MMDENTGMNTHTHKRSHTRMHTHNSQRHKGLGRNRQGQSDPFAEYRVILVTEA